MTGPNAPQPDAETADDGATPALQPSRPLKRSFSIAGHKTSISLEAAFWEAFRELCEADGVAMATQIAQIDRQRGDAAGLSGTVRVWILQRYRAAIDENATSAATCKQPCPGQNMLE